MSTPKKPDDGSKPDTFRESVKPTPGQRPLDERIGPCPPSAGEIANTLKPPPPRPEPKGK